MSDVRRIFVEKKPDFAIQAKELQSEIRRSEERRVGKECGS